MSIRIGFGIDFHPLREGRAFWLGGVQIPYSKGAWGHSDADVLLHAIADALLGALALGDIGVHFPDTNPAFKGLDSKIIIKKSYDLVKAKGYQIGNIDCTICLEQPKIQPFVAAMCTTIAEVLGISNQQISIKATTTEAMGFVGRGEGIQAYATVLVLSSPSV